VPLIDQALSYLTAGGVRRAFVAGEPVVLPLPGWKAGETVTVQAPDNGTLKPTVTTTAGTPLLRLDEAATPGVYTVEYGDGKSFPFVVNAGREDALLTAGRPGGAGGGWWKPVAVEVLQADEAARQLAGGGGWALGPFFVALAVLLLLLETFLVHHLCPRVNPATAEGIVHRRGLLRPLQSPQRQRGPTPALADAAGSENPRTFWSG